MASWMGLSAPSFPVGCWLSQPWQPVLLAFGSPGLRDTRALGCPRGFWVVLRRGHRGLEVAARDSPGQLPRAGSSRGTRVTACSGLEGTRSDQCSLHNLAWQPCSDQLGWNILPVRATAR